MDHVEEERDGPLVRPCPAAETCRQQEQSAKSGSSSSFRERLAMQRQRSDDDREPDLPEERMAESRLEDGVDRVPAERLAEAEAAGHRALEHDAERGRDHEPEGQAREDPEEPSAELRGRRAKDDRERDRAADDEQEQREVERARRT